MQDYNVFNNIRDEIFSSNPDININDYIKKFREATGNQFTDDDIVRSYNIAKRGRSVTDTAVKRGVDTSAYKPNQSDYVSMMKNAQQSGQPVKTGSKFDADIEVLFKNMDAKDVETIRGLGKGNAYAFDDAGNMFDLNTKEGVSKFAKWRQSAKNSFYQFGDRTVKEDFDLLKKAGKDAYNKAIQSITKGIADTPLAKALVRVGSSPATKGVLKTLGYGTGLLTAGLIAYDTITAGKNTVQHWNDEGSGWQSRLADIQATLSAPAWAGAGAATGLVTGGIGSVIGGAAGAAIGTANTMNKQREAEEYRQLGRQRIAAEKELEAMGLDPKTVTTSEIQSKFSPNSIAARNNYQGDDVIEGYNLDPSTDPDLQGIDYSGTQDYTVPPTQGLNYVDNQGVQTGGASQVAQGVTPQPSQPINLNYSDMLRDMYGFITGASQPQQQATQQPTIFDVYNASNPAMNESIQAQRNVVSATPQATPFDINPDTGVARVYDNVMASLDKTDNMINNDYRYQGDVAQPVNPYSIDTRKQNYYQGIDDFARMLGINSNLAGGYAQQQLNAYQGGIANQLGVPYQDYAEAMKARNEQMILNESERRKVYLEQAKNDAKTYTDMLAAQQALIDNDRKTREDLVKNAMQYMINPTISGMLDIEQARTTGDYGLMNQNLQNLGQMQQLNAKLNDPLNQSVKASTAAYNYATGLGGDTFANILYNSTPSQRQYLLNTGYPVSDEALNDIFLNASRRRELLRQQQRRPQNNFGIGNWFGGNAPQNLGTDLGM